MSTAITRRRFSVTPDSPRSPSSTSSEPKTGMPTTDESCAMGCPGASHRGQDAASSKGDLQRREIAASSGPTVNYAVPPLRLDEEVCFARPTEQITHEWPSVDVQGRPLCAWEGGEQLLKGICKRFRVVCVEKLCTLAIPSCVLRTLRRHPLPKILLKIPLKIQKPLLRFDGRPHLLFCRNQGNCASQGLRQRLRRFLKSFKRCCVESQGIWMLRGATVRNLGRDRRSTMRYTRHEASAIGVHSVNRQATCNLQHAASFVRWLQNWHHHHPSDVVVMLGGKLVYLGIAVGAARGALPKHGAPRLQA
eukprot:scaffold48_cov311-Pinguiococcus_pyrenoidosus.AAC.231